MSSSYIVIGVCCNLGNLANFLCMQRNLRFKEKHIFHEKFDETPIKKQFCRK